MASLCEKFQQELPHPFSLTQHPLPDIAHPTLLRTLQGHTSIVNGCAYSPDGRRIVSASRDETLRMWNVKNSLCNAVLRVECFLSDCSFCPDGEHVVTCGKRGVYFLSLM